MDYRDQSSIPGADGIWVPETPLKAILTEAEPIYMRKQDGQLRHENWLVTECSSQKSQAQRIVASCLSKSPIFNQEFEAAETSPANDTFSLDSSEVRWNETSFRDLLALADAATARRQSEVFVFDSQIEDSFPLPAGYLSLGTSLWGTEDCSLVMPQSGGNSIPSGRSYDLDSPSRMRGAVLSRTIPSQFAPITPDQTKRVENIGESIYKTANQARDTHQNEVAATRIEVNEHCKSKEQSQLQDSCADISTAMLENHNPDKEGNDGIDLNQTPQQKQRRRKHRPKVVLEGQPKRIQNPVASKPARNKENPTHKRKYVRRNGLNKSKATPTEVNRSADAERNGRPTRSCRKSLNFDFQSEVRDENYSTTNFIPASQPQNLHTRSESKSSNNSNCSTTTFAERKEANGLKRKHWFASNDNVNLMEAHYSSLQAYLMSAIDECSLHFPAIFKRKRTEKGYGSTTSTLSTMTATEYSPGQAITHPLNEAPANPYMPKTTNVRISAAQLTTSNTPIVDAAAKGIQNKQEASECMLALTRIKGLTKKRSKGPNRVRDLTSLNIIFENKPKPTYHFRRPITSGEMHGQVASNQPKTCMEALVAATSAPITTKKRTKKYHLPSLVPTSIYNGYRPQAKSKGAHQNQLRKKMSHIDAIVEQLKCLDINMETSEVANQQQSALVPYNLRYQQQNALVLYQRDGTVVPFEGAFYPVKERKPRAKVDLDEETNRVWKLLLENINSEGIDGTDEEKEKWWEEERKVFHGRVETFINRMHLVQGDRRFSPWKGSVVDSVIGVFLTQNVSDHLSSSAYMSLAARFPLKSNSNQGSYPEDRTSVLMKHVHVLDPEESMNWYDEKSNQPACDQNSTTSYEMGYNEEKEVVDSNKSPESNLGSVRSTDNSICELLDSSGNSGGTCLKSAGNELTTEIAGVVESFMGDQTDMEDTFSSQNYVISSQDSVNCGIAQTADRTHLEAYLTPSSEPNCLSGSISFVELLQMAGSTTLHEVTLHEVYNHESVDVLSNNKAVIMGCDSHKQEDRLDDPKSSSAPTIPPSNCSLQMTSNSQLLSVERIENRTSKHGALTAESVIQARDQMINTENFQEAPIYSYPCHCIQKEMSKALHSQIRTVLEQKGHIESWNQGYNCEMQQVSEAPSRSTLDITESTSIIDNPIETKHKADNIILNEHDYLIDKTANQINKATSKLKKERARKEKHNTVDWDNLRKQAQASGKRGEREANTMDSLDWEAVRCASVNEIAYTIKERGMNNMLAERIKDFLNRLAREHGSIDLEWLRDVPPDKAKEYLLSIRGLGLKSVECVRLLTLHHLAFPVDTNVGRIVVRLGWVPLQPLPDSLQLHLLELYPVLESIQKYLWPRLCKLDQRTLYELHYQMITFGKVFCTKSKPNCNACPMRGECRHFASAFASTRLALPGPEEKRIVSATETRASCQNSFGIINPLQLPLPQANQQPDAKSELNNCQPIIEMPTMPEPIIEVPPTPEPIIEIPPTPEREHVQTPETDIEDILCEDPNEIPTIKLNIEEFTQNLHNYMQQNMELHEGEMSKALVALTPEAASIPMPKLKNVSRLRTEHHVYELPDSHPLLAGLDKREPDDPCSYLLAIWTPGETANSIQPPEGRCSSQEFGRLCDEKTCFSCNSMREANSQIVRGTLLIPCRTAMRGRFPLNGTYFQVNEVFADHESSINPIDVPRAWVWNLPRRTVYFGTSIPTIFKGLSTEGIQYCFWKGLVCVRGFDQKTRAPRPLMARLHFPASKLTKTKVKTDDG